MLQCFNLFGDLVKALLQVGLRSVLNLFLAETVTRIVKLELGFQLGTFGIQTMKIGVVHTSTTRYRDP